MKRSEAERLCREKLSPFDDQPSESSVVAGKRPSPPAYYRHDGYTEARTNYSLALDEPSRSPRELVVRFTDSEKYFVLRGAKPSGFVVGRPTACIDLSRTSRRRALVET
jgi:hypothetical protein